MPQQDPTQNIADDAKKQVSASELLMPPYLEVFKLVYLVGRFLIWMGTNILLPQSNKQTTLQNVGV
jgi:hypothetical protein